MDLAIFQQTVMYVDQNYIPIMPLCEFFGITYKWQISVIKKDPILKTEWKKTSSEMQFGDKRSRVCLTKKGFIRWVQLLKADLVKLELKEKFLYYQTMIFDFMYGGIEKKEQTAVTYARLKKLRTLYGKIGTEINKCERQIKQYVDGHLLNQLTLFN